MPDYFKDSKVMKEQLITMDLPSQTMLLLADSTSMYKNIQTRTALNQISQYVNGNKTRYLNLPVNAMLGALHLIIKTIFSVSLISTGYNSKSQLW